MSLSALVLLLAGVVAPYGEAPPPRYGEPPAATFDAFTAAPPTAAAVPVAGQWNNGPTYVADAAAAASAGPIQRLGTELQNAAAPIQEGFDRFGNRIGAAAENLGVRTDQLLDEIGGQTRSILGRSDAPSATSLPPQYAVPDPAAGGQWNTGATGAAGASAAPPAGPANGSDWNQGPSASGVGPTDAGMGWNGGAVEGQPSGVAPGQFPPANQVGPLAPPLVNGNSPQASFPQGQPASSAPAAPVTAVNNDRWSNSADPRFRTATASAAGNAAGDSATPFTGAGPILPPPPYDPHAGAGSVPPAENSDRAIRGGMLDLPANRQLDDAAAPAAGSPAAFPGMGFPTPSPTVPNTPSMPGSRPANAGGGVVSSYPNWNSSTNAAAASTPPAATAEAAASSARDKAAVILAWVLLFASIAGNIYLFWSYLDVRTKYRSLVRKTARAVGSRFSAA